MALPFTSFDHRGDLKLRIGPQGEPDTVVYTVCSRALARVSPVYNSMLYGGFAEGLSNRGRAADDWVVDLPHDKPGPMAVLLSIVHGHFGRVPKALGIDDLYDLTGLTHYYDATHSLAPWAGRWMEAMDRLERDAVELTPRLLWISWELGWKHTFSAVARRMLLYAEVADLCGEKLQERDTQFPPDIIEHISKIRIQTVQALIDIFGDMAETLVVVDEKPRWCHHATWMGPHRCESMILGSLTFCLTRAGLWPLPAADEVAESLTAVYTKMTSLVIHDIGRADELHVNHDECNPGPLLLDRVQTVMGQIPSPVTDSHLDYMAKQAVKLDH